jgi:hypothetical protein
MASQVWHFLHHKGGWSSEEEGDKDEHDPEPVHSFTDV